MAKKTPRPIAADDRRAPCNLEAERALLGSVLIDNACLNHVLESISKDDFYSEAHRIAFEAMRGLHDDRRAIELVTLCESLSVSGMLEKAGGAVYISALSDGVPIGTTSALADYCRIVRDKSTLRSLINVSNNTVAKAYDSAGEADSLVADAQDDLYRLSLRTNRSRAFRSVGDIIRQEIEYFDKVLKGGTALTGISTGLEDLDAMTHGLHPQELTIIAARPSQGKTALGLSMALEAAKRGVPVGFFSMEMGDASLVLRLICMEARINLWKAATGFSSREEMLRLTMALGRLSKLPLYIDDTAKLTMTELRAKARRLKAEHDAALFFADYIQLFTSSRKFSSRNDEVGYYSSSLKAFAKDEKVPFVALSQLSRAPERGRKRKPDLPDLRESGNIEQDADVVIFIHRDKKKTQEFDEAGDEAGAWQVVLIVGKQRNGPTGEVPVVFLKPFAKFENQARGGYEEHVSVP